MWTDARESTVHTSNNNIVFGRDKWKKLTRFARIPGPNLSRYGVADSLAPYETALIIYDIHKSDQSASDRPIIGVLDVDC